MMKRLVGKYDFEEPYNLEAAKMINLVLGGMPLFVVGGLRKVEQMNMKFRKLPRSCAYCEHYSFMRTS